VDAAVDADVDEADLAADNEVAASATNGNIKLAKNKQSKQNPLSWLMSRASFLARTLIVNRPASHIPYLAMQWTRPVMSILRFFAGSIQAMDEGLARRYARHVLSPVYRVLDEGGELSAIKEGDDGLGKSFTATSSPYRSKTPGYPPSVLAQQMSCTNARARMPYNP
jgi:hypothetical protein